MSTASPALGPAPSKHKAAAPTQPWHWRWRRAAGHYLPVILMALLAASTWWLVKNSIPAARTPESAPPKHEPDYEMRGFRLERYQANGQPKAQISGQLVRHYPDTDTLEIDQVKLRSIGPDGHTTTATAQKAVAQGDGSEVELIGNAQVTRASLGPHDAVIQFRSNYLRVYIDQERVTTDQAVTMKHGNQTFQAGGMTYTHSNGSIVWSGRARAVFSGP
jgi:lipopolysaccharide export system protein LptC